MMRSQQQTILPAITAAPTNGRSFPVGTPLAGGANFSVFSRSAAGIDLLHFDSPDDTRPSRVIPIDPGVNRTLIDVVSHNHKHNEENGEHNRDGIDENRSWNCGWEGPTEDPAIETLRNRQVKNLFTALMLSGGVPMFVMGDEVRRSQRGNNNAYCQDNYISWFDWDLVSKHADVFRFVRLLIARRLRRDVEHEQRRASLRQVLSETKAAWHGVKLNQPDWSPCSNSIAIGGEFRKEAVSAHIILNAFWEPLDFEIPPLSGGGSWKRWIDTALDAPNEICEWNAEQAIPAGAYRVGARSVVVLIAPNGTGLQS